MKVCVIYGSESGTAERGIRTIAKGWKESKGIEVSSIMEGADAARIGLASLAEQYDFLAVATSSNGEGDPPYNFHPFLKALYEADDAGDKPLTGCGFAVLGFGCSHFDTFQNCPRLTDKLLGQLGASRRVQRAEVDEIDADAGDVSKKTMYFARTSMSSNCFSKASISLEIFSTFIDFKADERPLLTLTILFCIAWFLTTVSRRCATASILALILR